MATERSVRDRGEQVEILPDRAMWRRARRGEVSTGETLAKGIESMRQGQGTRVLAFAFRRGIPMDADAVLDARVIRNPYRDRRLRRLDGFHADVRADVMSNPAASDLVRQGANAVAGGASVVAYGCHAGKHRSVALGLELVDRLRATGAAATFARIG